MVGRCLSLVGSQIGMGGIKLCLEIPLERGVKQGDVISPTLFLIFMAPLQWRLLKQSKSKGFINNLAYADDLVLISHLKAEMETLIKILRNFSRITGIELNGKKSAYMNNTNSINTNALEDIVKLKEEETYRYLGIRVNLELSLKDQIKFYKTRILPLTQKITKKNYLTIKHKVIIINSILFGILRYLFRNIIPSEEEIKELEKLYSNP